MIVSRGWCAKNHFFIGLKIFRPILTCLVAPIVHTVHHSYTQWWCIMRGNKMMYNWANVAMLTLAFCNQSAKSCWRPGKIVAGYEGHHGQKVCWAVAERQKFVVLANRCSCATLVPKTTGVGDVGIGNLHCVKRHGMALASGEAQILGD